MNRALVGSIAAGAVAVGATLVATHPTPRSLPDVQVPAIQLSNAEGVDATVAWLDLFNQTSGGNADTLGGNLVDQSGAPMVVIEPQGTAEDFDRILDNVVGKAGSELHAVTSPGNGPDAATYLILNNAS